MSDANTAQDQYHIADKMVIENLETLKVVADPLRLRILDVFDDKPHTVKQIAKVLGIPPNKLYYHVNMLEEHGLIRVVDTRIVSGIIEKLYLISAHQITPAKGLLSPGGPGNTEGWEVMLDSIFEDNKQLLLESVRHGVVDLSKENGTHTSFNFGTHSLELTSAEAKDFNKRLVELVGEFTNLKHENSDDVKVYRLFISFFLTNRPPDAPEDENSD
jgi:DNA-binding transcriptional ArsR family regulator